MFRSPSIEATAPAAARTYFFQRQCAIEFARVKHFVDNHLRFEHSQVQISPDDLRNFPSFTLTPLGTCSTLSLEHGCHPFGTRSGCIRRLLPAKLESDMPSITINGKPCEFDKGETILQVANRNGIDIPQYCYHDGLSIVASCRICLAEVHAPNPRNANKLEPIPQLLPTCQTPAGDGQVVYTDSPPATQTQHAVM